MSAPLVWTPFLLLLEQPVDCCARQKRPTVFSFNRAPLPAALNRRRAIAINFTPRHRTHPLTLPMPPHAAARRRLLPRYQHLDVYLPPSSNPGTSPAPTAASAAAGQPAKSSASGPGGASPVPGPLATAATTTRTEQRASALGQHLLPAIDFTGAAKRDAAAGVREGGQRGGVKPSATRQPSSESGGVTPTEAEGGTADQAGGCGGGTASGGLEETGVVDSGEETTSVDGEEEDFLALPAGRAESNGGDGGEVTRFFPKRIKEGWMQTVTTAARVLGPSTKPCVVVSRLLVALGEGGALAQLSRA